MLKTQTRTDLRRRLHRDRRRLGVAASLALAGLMLGGVPGDPALLLSGETLGLLAVLGFVLAVSLNWPRHRFAVETVALGNVIFIACGRIWPWANFNLANPEVNWLSAFILYTLTLGAVRYVFYGRWADRFRRPGVVVARASAWSELTAQELWYGLVPTPGHLDECADSEVVSIDYADRTRRVVRLVNWMPPAERSQTLLHIEEIAPFRHVRLRVDHEGASRGAATNGVTTLRIIDEGARRRVEVAHEMTGLAPRRVLRGWIDDTLGRMLDYRLQGVEHAVRALRCRTMAKRDAARAGPSTLEVFRDLQRAEPRVAHERRARPTSARHLPSRH